MSRRARAVVVSVLLAGACSTVEQVAISPDEAVRHLPVLGQPGAGQAELLLALGPPSAVFESGRVLCWRLTNATGRLQPAVLLPSLDFGDAGAWARAHYSLVAVFAAGGRLERHALIAVR